MSRVSVIIPIYIANPENIAMTVKCIEKAKKGISEDVEWIIVETCTDYFMEYADTYIYEKEKTTPTTSINKGFKVASGEYVVLLTNDVFVEEGWLDALLDCFKKEDCGLSTLGSDEFNQSKKDLIQEFVYFPVAMIPKKYAKFDEKYVTCFNDTDIIMQVYIDGLKMYQNLNSIVQHLSRATQGVLPTTDEKYVHDKNIFISKYNKYKDMKMYKQLTGEL